MMVDSFVVISNIEQRYYSRKVLDRALRDCGHFSSVGVITLRELFTVAFQSGMHESLGE